MAHSSRVIPAALLVLGGLAGTAFAQQLAAPKAPPSTSGTPQETPGTPWAPTEPGEEAASFPVFAVTGVEVLRSAHTPGVDILLVTGLASAAGWNGGELVPLRRAGPDQDVLDLLFVAQAPLESAPPTQYVPMQAVLPLPAGQTLKRVHVRSATNSVALSTLPGYAASKPPAEPCDPCVGKLLLPRGASAPTGVSPDDIVHEESLPPLARVVRPEDGFPDIRPNPNRLTLIVGEDGRIADAAWE
ncbi:MAG: hypothetical protein INR62_05805 [Rhodospirillales bacterium]|nr:hypothetical protein [Acetobacter sp.]